MSQDTSHSVSRRRFLDTVGAVAVAGGLVGQSRAGGRTERRVVGTATADAQSAVRGRATRIVHELDFGAHGGAVVADFPAGSDVRVQGRSDVRYVESDTAVSVLGYEADEPAGAVDIERQLTPWGVERIGASDLHDQKITGDGADVAIIDTGIDSDHPDLQANLGKGHAVVANDEERREWDDDHDHGTHCAGIVGAAPNQRGVLGTCPQITLHAVKVISADGGGSSADMAAGLVWAVDEGYDVASLSLGSTSPSEVIHDAVKYAVDNGVTVVAAAGNEAPDEETVHYPAAFPEAIAVGATDDNDDLADFSITGDAVEIAAPGVEIPSTTIGDYKYFSGTSMATPHVAGAAGILASIGFSRTEIRQRLVETAVDIGYDQDETGNGLLDAAAAVGDASGGGGDDGAGGFAVETRSATSVERTAATLTGEVLGLGDHTTATVGFEYWVADDPEAEKRTVEAGERSKPGQYSATIEGLESDTTYVVRATASAGETTVAGRQTDFTTVAKPTDVLTIETGPARDIDEDEAELVGRITEIDAEEAAVDFEFWPEGEESALRRTDTDDLDEPEAFDEDAEDLQPGTKYTYVARAVVDDLEIRGGEKSFTTLGGPDDGSGDGTLTVETVGTGDVAEDEAELVGRVTDLGGAEEATVDFEFWPEGEESGLARTDTDDLDELEDFAEDAEDLQPGTTYTYVARAVAGDTEVRGAEQTFTTPGDAPDAGDGDLTVETVGTGDLDDDEAELVGRVTDLGGAQEATVDFEFWPAGDESALRRTDSDGVDEPEDFAEDAEDLQPGTTYTYVARGVVDDVEVRGAEQTFTTAGDAPDAGDGELTVETVGTGDVDDDEAELVGRVIDLGGAEEVLAGFEFWPAGDESALRRTETDDLDEPDDFAEDAEDLASGQTYVGRAVCSVDGETVRGSEIEFTTE